MSHSTAFANTIARHFVSQGEIRTNVHEYEFVWIIREFHQISRLVTSPKFATASDSDISWFVECGKVSTENDVFFLRLRLGPNCRWNGTFGSFCCISFRNTNDEEIITTTKKVTYDFKHEKFRQWKFQRTSLFSRYNWLPFDLLKVHFKIRWATEIDDGIPQFFDVPEDSPNMRHRFMNYASSLLESGKHSDLEIDVGGTVIKAHKAVLAAHSSVFEAMFDHPFSESNTGRVIIMDLSLAAVQEFLKYIYTGDKPVLECIDLAKELYTVSDKYAVDSLKVWCREYLTLSMDSSNALDMLFLADGHSDTILRRKASDYIKSHSKDILNPEKCEFIVNMRPQLLLDIWSKKDRNIQRLDTEEPACG